MYLIVTQCLICYICLYLLYLFSFTTYVIIPIPTAYAQHILITQNILTLHSYETSQQKNMHNHRSITQNITTSHLNHKFRAPTLLATNIYVNNTALVTKNNAHCYRVYIILIIFGINSYHHKFSKGLPFPTFDLNCIIHLFKYQTEKNQHTITSVTVINFCNNYNNWLITLYLYPTYASPSSIQCLINSPGYIPKLCCVTLNHRMSTTTSDLFTTTTHLILMNVQAKASQGNHFPSITYLFTRFAAHNTFHPFISRTFSKKNPQKSKVTNYLTNSNDRDRVPLHLSHCTCGRLIYLTTKCMNRATARRLQCKIISMLAKSSLYYCLIPHTPRNG